MVAVTGASQASLVFQGRLADGTASATCTASGANKCTYFFDTTLNITILNNWNIGSGHWSPGAAAGSAQALAASAGLAASGLSGWVLPTGDGFAAAAGADNQYLSIWNSVGNSYAGLTNQFDGVQSALYMSSSELTQFPGPGFPWTFDASNNGYQDIDFSLGAWQALAVRPGDLAAAVPEPQTLALALLALGAAVIAGRRRAA